MTKLKAASVGALGIGVLILAADLSKDLPFFRHRSASQRVAVKRDSEALLRRHVGEAFSKLPITFVENRGQTNSRVRYFARGSRYAFSIMPDEIVLSLAKARRRGGLENQAREAYPLAGNVGLIKVGAANVEAGQQALESVTLGLKFLGANPQVIIDGAERAPGTMNYLRGSNPEEWRTDVPTYAKVIYHELWPGVDLSVRARDGALKYEFHVRPGARIEDIRLAYRGATDLSLDSAGQLLLQTRAGTIRDSAPVSFQEIDGVQVPVESRYLLTGAGKAFGFRVAASYRPDRELIIDPGIEYSTFLGGASNEIATGVTVDAAGNAYIVGWTQSPDFPTTPGAFDRTGSANNNADVFVAKINATGTALVYSTFIGGSNMDFGRAIAIDGAGNAYIAGQTKSSDFPTTSNAFDRSLNFLNCPRCSIDATDAFVAKLNPNGSALVYSTFLGGATSIDDALGIAVDAAGSAYVAGETSSTDFPTTAGAFRRTNSGGDDAYLAKLNPSGSTLVYSTLIGGSQEDFAVRVQVDASNNAYVVGNTSSSDFPTTPGSFDTSANGGFDTFVLKLNATGSNMLYSTFLGGTNVDFAGGLAIDGSGDAYVSGATLSSDYPTTPGAFQPVCTSSGGFLTKLNPAGSALIYSTCLVDGGSTAVAVSLAGNAWITGATSSQLFPTTPDAFQHFPASGSSDAFLTELNATGSAILYSTYLGGSDTDSGNDLGLDTAGNVYVVGLTRSSDFPTTANALDRVFKGRLDIFWGDGFISKLELNGVPPPPPPLPTVASLSAPLGVVGGNTVTVSVTLTSGAQNNGAVIVLSSSNPAVLPVPATLTIPAGAQSGAITTLTSLVPVNTAVNITASFNNSSKAATVTVMPTPPPAALSSVGMFPNVVTGGTATIGILALTNPAPAGGFSAALTSNNPIASVPSSVTVPAGETNVSFSVPTAQVTQSTGLTIFATAGGRTVLTPLTVNPGTPPVTNVGLTVSASGRSGERVISSPAGISVLVGSSMQALFPSGTNVTLSVSSGRDAIWSGACSSGGTKKKSCALTLNGPSTVSANVQ